MIDYLFTPDTDKSQRRTTMNRVVIPGNNVRSSIGRQFDWKSMDSSRNYMTSSIFGYGLIPRGIQQRRERRSLSPAEKWLIIIIIRWVSDVKNDRGVVGDVDHAAFSHGRGDRWVSNLYSNQWFLTCICITEIQHLTSQQETVGADGPRHIRPQTPAKSILPNVLAILTHTIHCT